MKIYSFEHVSERSAKHIRKAWKWSTRNKRLLLSWAFRAFAIGVALIAVMFIYFSFTLPDPNTLLQRTVPESTKIYDRNGELLYEIHGEAKRTLVQLDAISPFVKNATVAVEDKDFYKHNGISFRGILRSVWVDITSGSKQQGGSTITQQFVKNALLTKDKKLSRKLKEVILSIELEARYSKDQILQLYLNEIPYGRNAYGIEAAAKSYFSKSAKDLTLAESAYLAALPQSTTYYNPFGPNREALDRRQQTILGLMEAQGYITAVEKEAANQEKVAFTPPQNSLKAPHFVLYVQDYLAEKFGEDSLEEGGLKVYTTLDLHLQTIAEEAIAERVEKNATTYNAHNAALVAIDPKTGQILSMVGSKDFFGESQPAGCKPGKDCLFDPSVNVALSLRQPGSSFKPYVYLTAFKKEFGYSPASMLMDVTTNFGSYGGKSYIPKNYTGANFGPVSMRQALAGSLNIPAVKTLALVGVNNAIKTAKDLGITSTFNDCGLSLVLGGCEVKLLDHTNAYATIGNGGVFNPATPILKIESRTGEILEEYTDKSQRAVDAEAVFELTSILTDNQARSYIFGINNPLTLPGRQLACKTGTTNEWRDGWTMCTTPSIAVGVWTGNNYAKEPMKRNADGVVVAAPIVNSFLKQALAGKPAEEFSQPQGIQRITVDSTSGKLPTSYTPQTKEEIFASYSTPTQYDDVHVVVRIDKTTGLAATSNTPPENVEFRSYTVFRSERPDDAAWEEPVRKWMENKGYAYPPNGSSYGGQPGDTNAPQVTIQQPQNGGRITQSPFTIQPKISGTSTIVKVDLLIDGQLIESKTSEPYFFTVSKKIADGERTIAIHVTDEYGRSADTSIQATFSTTSSLNIASPTKDQTISSPVAFQAVSNDNLGTVTFYLNDAPVGGSAGIRMQDGTYAYSTLWDAPAPGMYLLQARATGMTSSKITFTVAE
ncbi:MAG: penicillin-binding protein [Candidatus Doudnabacteria bacterium]|nr:penicillin-binding protein [Candidatus Doudnabacteria bacterium]